MKKAVIFTGLFFLLFLSGFSQVLEFTYTFDNPKIEKKDGYDIVTFKQTKLAGKYGEPVLPFKAIKLLLPPGTEVKKIDFEYSGETALPQKINLYPQQNVRPVGSTGGKNFYVNKDIYHSNKYPENAVYSISTQYMNGYAVALGSFSPVVYYPGQKKLVYYKKVKVRIEYQKAKNSKNRLQPKAKPSIIKKITNYVDNPEQLKSYSLESKVNPGDYEVLIITSSAYAGSFSELQANYLKRGLRSEVKTVEEIDNEMSGQDLPEKIRNYIIQEYNAHAIEYVLLGGDVDVVPYRGFYCSANSPHGSSEYITDDNIPADLYFSSLDGTWNDDGDNLWGEPGEDDLLPDVAVGRLPFSNQTELTNMLNKDLSFVNNPVIGELNKSLLAGEYLYDDPETWGADYLDLLIGYHTDNGYTTNGIPETFPYDTLYERAGQKWSGTTIINYINSGYPWVHHVGHSNSDYMMQLYSSDITDQNFSQTNGIDHTFTIVYSHGCICGAFDNDDCIAEESLKIQNFAVAELVNSRYGWFNEGQTEGPSEHLHREFVDALYNDKENHLGKAEAISKAETAPFVGLPDEWEPGAQRWVFYDHNLQGDPAMRGWTDNPYNVQVNYPSNFTFGENPVSITANGNYVENATFAVVQNNQLIGIGYTDQDGQASVSLWDNAQIGSAKLYVSGYNLLLHEYDIEITPNTGTYLYLASFSVIDGDNNQPNYNEILTLDLTIKNAGSEPATNVNISISGSGDFSILTSQDQIGTIDGEASVNNQNLKIKIKYPADYQADTLHLTITSDQFTKQSDIILTYFTPKFKTEQIQILELSGDGDGTLEPGETGLIKFTVKNTGHYRAADGTVEFSSNSAGLSVLNPQINVHGFNADDTLQFVCKIALDDNFDPDSTVNLSASYSAEGYSLIINLNAQITPAIEDFETGDFTKFNWQFGGNQPWQITSAGVHQGSYSALSGDIDDSETSEAFLSLNFLSDGDVSFYYTVSSEENYDYLKFYIDNVLQGEWSGQTGWSFASYPVTAGEHTLKWVYEKDGSVSEGSDNAAIDDITFPPIGTSAENDTIIPAGVNSGFANSLSVYPNPFVNILNIDIASDKNQTAHIEIYDLQGKLVSQSKAKLLKGRNTLTIYTGNLKGESIFVIKIRTGDKIFVKKAVKM